MGNCYNFNYRKITCTHCGVKATKNATMIKMWRKCYENGAFEEIVKYLFAYLERLWMISYFVTMCKVPLSSLLITAPVSFEINELNLSTGISNATDG